MDQWAPLAEGRTPRRYAPGQLIYLQGTPATEFYYLIQGTARSFLSSESGGERVLAVHRAGDLMGEASFFDECPRVSSSEAVEPCLVIPVTREQLDGVFRQHPELALPMLQYLARTVGLLSRHVDDVTFRPAGQRVARYLLSLSEGAHVVQCTQEEIGFAVGLSRVTVSRVLADFSRLGLLRTGYRCVEILDRAGLARQGGQTGP